MDLVLIPVVIAVCRRETRLNNLKTNIEVRKGAGERERKGRKRVRD